MILFSSQRYITRGVNSDIPFLTQTLIWTLVDKLKANGDLPLDYLQIFDLCCYGNHQKITHRQELPPHRKDYSFKMDNAVIGKIYVIDSGEYATMLLAEEY